MNELANDSKHPVLAAFESKQKSFQLEFTNPLTQLLVGLPNQICVIDKVNLDKEDPDGTVEIICKNTRKRLIGIRGGDDRTDRLLSLAVPSSFGKGGENVYDLTVRDGKELRNGVHIEASSPEKLDDFIQRTIGKKIKPVLFPSATSLEFKFNKIAIYEEGGHFQSHRDTAYAPNHKGTLLVALPTRHTGGKLVLSPLNGPKVTWKLLQTYDMHYCAFYTDIVHEVRPVTSGVRMVMQFDIYCTYPPTTDTTGTSDNINLQTTTVAIKETKKGRKRDEVEKLDEEEDYVYPKYALQGPPKQDVLDLILQQVHLQLSHKPNHALALPLYHLYPQSGIRPEYLNTVDRCLFDALIKAGYMLQLVPIIIHARESLDDNGESFYYPIKANENDYGWGSGFSAYPCNKVKAAFIKGTTEGKDLQVLSIDTDRLVEEVITYTMTLYEDKALIFSHSHAEYTGNEAMVGESTYFACAMIIRLPEVRVIVEIVEV